MKLILNHKSAEEDMLLSQSSLKKKQDSTAVKNDDDENQEASSGQASTTASGAADPSDASPSSADESFTAALGDTSSGGGAGNGEDGESPSATHVLGFGGVAAAGENAGGEGEDLSFLIRELPIRNPDECFGDDAREDTTGVCLWAAAVVLARWMASPEIRARLDGQTVVELGAGCGAG